MNMKEEINKIFIVNTELKIYSENRVNQFLNRKQYVYSTMLY